MRAVILAAVLLGPPAAHAADVTAPTAPLALLTDSFGAQGVETLAARGVIILQGDVRARRLASVHWKAFGDLEKAMPSCLALVAAADALGREPEPQSAGLGFAPCRSLTPSGIMTPSLHALASALEAAHEERWALRLASAPPSGAPKFPNLFDTSWGKDLIARGHADALENPASLAKPVFETLLAGPRPEPGAAALFAAEASARGTDSVEALIAHDRATGTMSEELRAQLRRTLSNERRRWAAAQARSAAAGHLSKSAVRRDLDDLRNAAKAFASRPNLPAALEAAFSRAAPTGDVSLKSAGLHLHKPTRLGQHELGDEAVVSGAYWVDGLKENESLPIEETIALETKAGFLLVETRSYKRRNGGPYTYSRTIPISETRPFTVLSLVSAGGAPISERVEVAVAPDFELALVKESEAAGLRAGCRFKDAEAAYSSLETLVASAAKIKPQYKSLANRARKAGEASKADAETLMSLEEALAAARPDSSPQICRYETNRVEAALKLAKRLPPGCDRDLPELHALRAMIVRRGADLTWFLKASAQARSKFKSCELDAAHSRWSEALASLDADPAARCGRAVDEESRAKMELSETAKLIAWRENLDKSIAQAESETAPARRLELLQPVISRLGFLKTNCFNAETKRANALIAAAQKSLSAPEDKELARRVPADAALTSVVSEIKASRARRAEAATAVEKVAIEPTAAVVPTPKAPATKAAAIKAPAKRPQNKKKGNATR